jgi:hypothetical protein
LFRRGHCIRIDITSSALTISPTEVNIGESVTISVDIANTGDLSGSHDVTLEVNNAVIETKKITLTGHASQKVIFTTSRDKVGSYTVILDNLSGTFIVKEVLTSATTPTPMPTLEIPPAPVSISEIPLTPALIPLPAPTPTNWRLIGGLIVAAIMIIGLLIYLLWWRKRLS